MPKVIVIMALQITSFVQGEQYSERLCPEHLDGNSFAKHDHQRMLRSLPVVHRCVADAKDPAQDECI